MADTAAAPATPAAKPAKPVYDFLIAANDVDRTDIGGNFHIAGKGFGDEVGSITIGGRNAYVLLSNDPPHAARWSDENIYGQLPPMCVSGEIIVTTHDGRVQKGYVKLLDRFAGLDPKADRTDDKIETKPQR